MSAALYESIARVARHEAMARLVAGAGVVEDVFDGAGTPRDHAVTVKMRDTGLVLPRVPIAVGALGFAATPAPGDLVVIVFLEGQAHAPVVVGRLHRADLDPPKHAAGELVLQLPPGAAEPGVDLRIAAEEPVIRLALPGDVVVEIREEKIQLTAGAMTVTVQAGGGGRVKLAAGGTEVNLAEDGDLTLRTSGKLLLEGGEVEIKGSTGVKIDGATVEIN